MQPLSDTRDVEQILQAPQCDRVRTAAGSQYPHNQDQVCYSVGLYQVSFET